MSCHPRLVELLRQHLADHGTMPDGRLFRGTRGGPIAESVYGRIWANAGSVPREQENRVMINGPA